MLEQFSSNLENVFKKIRGHGKLSESNISDATREIRRALLEADVNFKVAKDFIEKVKTKALGDDVLRSISPGQQIVKIVRDELSALMGDDSGDMHLSGSPAIIMLVGLQGSGKTTSAAKLAMQLRKQGRRPMMVACDVYRPAAIKQLETLGKQIDIPVYSNHQEKDVLKIAETAIKESVRFSADTVIIDTAGRLTVDSAMMDEIKNLKTRLSPKEILFVGDGMTGQDAVATAQAFSDVVQFTGVILTKMDGDARGGAALSIKAVTGIPVKFLGMGEKIQPLEVFHPSRMADRILGMGDIVSLVEKAQESIDENEARLMEEKIRKSGFDLEDFRDQLLKLKKMGPLSDLMGMIPGMSKVKDVQVDEKRLTRIEAIINSMTPSERRLPKVLNANRRKRIARGSGTTVQDVNQLMKQFQGMQKMMKKFGKMGKRQLMRNLPRGFKI
mgnify:CR=1 FL=1|jgi:signal recognition particle subunit SRP54